MELRFDLWHLAFVSLIERRAPPNFEIQSEVRLTIEPQRADMMLLRRVGAERKDDQALVLRALAPARAGGDRRVQEPGRLGVPARVLMIT